MVHLRLIAKGVVDLNILISVNGTFFSLSVTAEALRVNIDRKSAFSLKQGQNRYN